MLKRYQISGNKYKSSLQGTLFIWRRATINRMLKRFISYYKPYKKTFIFVMIIDLFISIISMLYPIITRNMLNDFIPNRKFNLIITFGIALLALYLIKAVLKYLFDFYGHVVGTGIQTDMRRDLFNKLEQLPFSFFDNNETGRIMSRITNDLQDISELAHHGPENVFMCSFMIIFSFCYLSSISLSLTLIIFACIPFLVYITLKLRKKHLISTRNAKASMAQINGDVNSSISGIRVTKAFNNSEKELEKFEVGNQNFIKAKRGQYFTMSLLHASTNLITDIFNVVCLISGGIFLYQGKITFGDYSTFIVSINVFITPVNTLINFMEMFQEGVTGFERFVEIMDKPTEVDREGAKEIKNLNGDIEFKNVSFAYNEEDNEEILDNVSFKVKKGKTIALVGPSGGGKTTICHLLPKFYHANEGEILINGINVEDIKMASLRENIGIVQQDVFLFSGSFYDNILYGNLNASKKQVIEAAKKANIYDYIMSLPNGFDTEIGERGIRLSGGQKQRLSIARVFLKNPSILILDEATSALDNVTEVLIQDALNSLKKGRTTIVVAHRLSTIKNANEILVVSKGKIVEKGTHNSLIRKPRGIYKGLYNSQFKDKKLNGQIKTMMH